MRPAVLLAAVWLALPSQVMAQKEQKPSTPPQTTTPSEGGPVPTRVRIRGEIVIGDRAPDFELDASNGRPLRIASLRGDWVLLVFDSRKEDVAALQPVNTELRTLGVRLVGVCDEKAYHLESFAKKENFPYPLLADPTGEISAVYGLFDGERSTTGPGFVLLDREGYVRMAILGQRFPAEDVLHLIRFTITGL